MELFLNTVAEFFLTDTYPHILVNEWGDLGDSSKGFLTAIFQPIQSWDDYSLVCPRGTSFSFFL